MRNPTLGIFGQRNIVTGMFEFYVVEHRSDGSRAIAQPLVMQEASSMIRPAAPTFAIPFEDKGMMQQLVNELAGMGFLPDSSSATQGELASVRYHLEDMRKLAKLK